MASKSQVVSFVVLCLLVQPALITHAQQSRASATPEWIWSSGDRNGSGQAVKISTEFSIEQQVVEARLRLATDFASASAYLNKKSLVHLDAYGPWIAVDVLDYLTTGANELRVDAQSVEGPSAVLFELALKKADGSVEFVRSHAARTAKNTKHEPVRLVSFGNVRREFWEESTSTSSFDNYEQWRLATDKSGKNGGDKSRTRIKPAKISTRPGFRVELIRVAREEEDSWVSMAFDPKGRLVIAKEKQGLLRLTLAEESRSGRTGEEAVIEVVNDELRECRGLLFAFGSLYANANNSKAMYRLRDTNGDDSFDEVKLLRSFPGGVGHGRNDLALGLDGKIYSIHGDSVQIPTKDVADRTSPFRKARQGQSTTEGYLIRTDKDGENWEVVAAGLRNPFGIGVNTVGEIFTYDADAEHDMGAPWYRPTRIDHLVSGADFGWRGLTGKWPPHFSDHADNSLPVIDIGKGSPTAICSGAQTNFPDKYRKAMFVLDWTYGRVLACHQMPQGAGWFWKAETFVKGRPLNVTDVAVGPDGALYLITGGRGTVSSLYRITHDGSDVPTEASAVPTAQMAARTKFGLKQRQIRRSIEQRHEPGQDQAISEVWSFLDNADPTIRHAARTAIEHQPVFKWRELALADQHPKRAVVALLALARSREQNSAQQVIARLNQMKLAALSAYEQKMMIQAYVISCEQQERLDKSLKMAALVKLESWLVQLLRERESKSRNRQVAPTGSGLAIPLQLLSLTIQLGSQDAVPLGVEMLNQAITQEERMQILFLLRHQTAGWTSQTRHDYFSALVDLERNVLGGQGMPGFLRQIRDEAVKTLADNDKAELGDLMKPGNETPESELTIHQPMIKQWEVNDIPDILNSKHTPDTNRGHAVFKKALCVRCHRLHARGGVAGPDLSSVGSRFSKRDILISIIEPSRVVAEKYRNTQVITVDGKSFTGRVILGGDYRSETLKLAVDPLRPAKIVELDKKKIELHRHSAISPMPKGLLNTLTKEEINDLLFVLAP